MRIPSIALFLLSAIAGCKTETTVPFQRNPGDRPPESTINEKDAEETIRRSFQFIADWNLEAAYQLICAQDRRKQPLEAFRKENEANKDALIRMARQARIVSSGESTLPDGSPYVTVFVDLGQREIVPYSLIREGGGWRIILVDPRRARQSVK